MNVSLCIIAYNEEKVISNLLTQVKSQTYPHNKTEIILIDSASNDNTKEIFLNFAKKNQDNYNAVKVLDNPKKNQAAGWNAALKNAMGDVIIRVDAHAEIPNDFIEKNIEVIKSGEYICGGARPNIVDKPTNFKNMLFLAESSMFGSSFAGYRRKTNESKKYVNSLFHGAYRREVIEEVGGFNENLGRTEDNEFHFRIRTAGYKICQSDKIISYQHIRATLNSMLKQKYSNGKWIGLTAGVCPRCLSIFHFVPFCFVLALILSITALTVGAFTHIWYFLLPFVILMSVYILADLLMTVTAIIAAEKKHIIQILLPIIFFLLHCSYGIGTIIGFIMLPKWKSNLGNYAKLEIENVRKCVIENSKKS